MIHFFQQQNSKLSNYTDIAQKMKFSIKDFFSKCDQDLVTFTEEILNGKLHFLCSVMLTLDTRLVKNCEK